MKIISLVGGVFAVGITFTAIAWPVVAQDNNGRGELVFGTTGAIVGGGAGAVVGAPSTFGSGAAGTAGALAGQEMGEYLGRGVDAHAEHLKETYSLKTDPRYDPATLLELLNQ